MVKFFTHDEKKEDLSDIFIEIKYDNSDMEIKSIEDIKSIENQFKKIKGVYSTKFVPKRDDDTIPDIIALANWDKNEIQSKIEEINKIPNVIKVSWKELLKA